MVRHAKLSDMQRVLEIYAVARQYMRDNGNPTQWGDSYPEEEALLADIEAKRLFVCEDGGVISGVFMFIIGDEPTYAVIEDGEWPSNDPYGTIHRVASDGVRGGVFDECIAFCRGQMPCLRIDTHHNNLTMQHLIERSDFDYCGVIYVPDGSPRKAYQWNKP